MKLNSANQADIDYHNRIPSIMVAIFILFLVIIAKLWYLQILKGSQYKHFSEKNRIAKLWIPATRGVIYDRNQNILVDNRPSFNLIATRGYIDDIETTFDFLNNFLALNFDASTIKHKSTRLNHWPRYRQFTFAHDLTHEQLAKAMTHHQHPLMGGINIEVLPLRNYRNGPIGAHLYGYLGEITENELTSFNKDNTYLYRLGNKVGKFGLESTYEHLLRGIDGIKPVEIDARGRIRNDDPIGDLFTDDLERKPIPGKQLNLTIDEGLQTVAYNTFKEGESGSIVAMDPTNGNILALVNYPAFDPSAFASKIPSTLWATLNSDIRRPLQDKALRGTYSPGSTYKIVVAIAALEEKIITAQSQFHCPGYYIFAGHRFGCWRKEGHGTIDIHSAISQSCNVFFYQLGSKLGIDKIAKYASMFGLGQPTGIAINNEKHGLVPSKKWKKEKRNKPWYKGETLSCAIGQGYNLVTPIQLAQLISIVATKGVQFSPQLLQFPHNIQPKNILQIKPSTWKIVHDGLWGVLNDIKGTAYWYGRSSKYQISGKSGTSQVIALNNNDDLKDNHRFKDHALFVSFAPSTNPKIAVSVILEHGEGGSSNASPKAKEVIEYYLDKHISKHLSAVEPNGT